MGRHRYYVLGVLALIAMLSTGDQAVLVVTLPALQKDFRLTDSAIGLLSSAFVAVYGLTILVSGYLADRVRRRTIIAAGVFVWSLATLFTGLARSVPQLVLARATLGVGESTTLPSSISILGDYFTKHERGRAAAVLGAALQVGAGVGALLSGLVAAHYGWRSAFYLATLPGLVLAVIALTMREPVRGSGEPGPRPTATTIEAGGRAFANLIRIRSFTAAGLANTFVWFGISGVAGFMGLYVSRRFGVDLARVGALLAPPLLISGLVGNTAGGWLIDRRSRHSQRAPLEVATGGAALGALGMLGVFNAPTPVAFEIAFILAATAAQMAIPGLLAVNQNVVAPTLRGSATAGQQLLTNLLGRAGGLIAIGFAADHLHDLRLAFLLIAPCSLGLAALFALAGTSSMAKDTLAMEVEWAGRHSEPGAVPTSLVASAPRPAG